MEGRETGPLSLRRTLAELGAVLLNGHEWRRREGLDPS
jgi:hypothetical protein